MHFFSILSIFAFLLLPFCGYDWGPGSWFGISKIVQTTIMRRNSVPFPIPRWKVAHWEMNEGRGIGGQIVCLLHHQRLCLPGSKQHLSTNWLRSEEKTQPLEIVKLFYNKNNLNWGHSIVKRFKCSASIALVYSASGVLCMEEIHLMTFQLSFHFIWDGLLCHARGRGGQEQWMTWKKEGEGSEGEVGADGPVVARDGGGATFEEGGLWVLSIIDCLRSCCNTTWM